MLTWQLIENKVFVLNNIFEVTLGVHFVSKRFSEMNINVFSRLVPAAQYSQTFCPNRSVEILLKIPKHVSVRTA